MRLGGQSRGLVGDVKRFKPILALALLTLFAFALAFALAAPLASAAELSGTIYDINLTVASNVVVAVNTTPSQRVLSTNGTYAFELPPGSYKLVATYTKEGTQYTSSEYVSVVQEGKFIFDLFLLPDNFLGTDAGELGTGLNDTIGDDEELLFDFEGERRSDLAGVLERFLMVLIIGGFFYFVWRLLQKKELQGLEETGDDLAVHVLRIIKEAGGRISQKELRALLPQSEAKVSLVITELEAKGKLQKIKKGRGNVLVLKK